MVKGLPPEAPKSPQAGPFLDDSALFEGLTAGLINPLTT